MKSSVFMTIQTFDTVQNIIKVTRSHIISISQIDKLMCLTEVEHVLSDTVINIIKA